MDAHNEARTIISPPHQAIILNDSCIMNTAYNAPQTGSVPMSKETFAGEERRTVKFCTKKANRVQKMTK